MTRRRCESCDRSWLTFGSHDPCPDCGHVQRIELGMDAIPTEPVLRCVRDDLWDGWQERLPMA